MRLTCPGCGATNSLEALLNDGAARQAVATALALPANLGPRLLRYLGLFRPAQRSLTWDRAAHLLAELHTMIDAGEIRRQGRPWRVTPADWASALDQIIDRRASLTLPLKSHGYLLEILAGQANRVEAAQEEQLEEQRRQPRADAGQGMQAIHALLNRSCSLSGVEGNTAETPPHPGLPPPGGKGMRTAAPSPPQRTPPPDSFRNLAAQLRGHLNPEPKPTPEPDHD
jgi:hypothetical protein